MSNTIGSYNAPFHSSFKYDIEQTPVTHRHPPLRRERSVQYIAAFRRSSKLANPRSEISTWLSDAELPEEVLNNL